MLKTKLLHPEILRIAAQAGHHSTILIADGNYPASNKRGPRAELVSLQLVPGVPTVGQVLDALLDALPVDEINVMGVPEDDPYAAHGDPAVWASYRDIISQHGLPLELKPILKWEFYEAVASADHVLTVQTADQALWANVLLSLGVRTP